MTLQTGGEVRFKPRSIEGAPDASSKVMPESLLLDGQQRITSLYQTTMRQDVVDTMNSKKQKIKRFYYIDMAAALGTFNCSMTDANRKQIAAEIARLLGIGTCS